MRKHFLLSAAVVLITLPAFAQFLHKPNSRWRPPPRISTLGEGNRPLFYLGLSIGINNPSGFPGVDVDVPLSSHISVDGGAGPSTWGYKVQLGGKFYLKEYNRGFAFGAGAAYNTGSPKLDSGYVIAQNTPSGFTFIRQMPQASVFAAVYYYFTLGRAYNRFYAELGWSQRLAAPLYGVPANVQVDYQKLDLEPLFAPGGLMIGGGFSFGVRRK